MNQSGLFSVEARNCRGLVLTVRGNLEAAGPADALALRDMAHAHRLLVVRGVPPKPKCQLWFTKALGAIYGNRKAPLSGAYLPELRIEANHANNPYNRIWHCDTSWAARPARFTLLYCVTAEEGAVTDLADMIRGYQHLDATQRDRISGLHAYHHVDRARRERDVDAQPVTVEYDETPGLLGASRDRWRFGWEHSAHPLAAVDAPGTLHPLVGVSPGTGSPFVQLGEHAYRVDGLTQADGTALLADITEQCTQHYDAHRWEIGDLLIFENATYLHRRGDETTGHRVLRRSLAL